MFSTQRPVVFFEPTDRRKAAKPLQFRRSLTFSSPNLNELRVMGNFVDPHNSIEKTNDLHEVLKLAKIVSKAVDFLIITLGNKGIVTVKNSIDDSLVAKLYQVTTISNVENVSGAGDCFTSGFISGMLSSYRESKNVHIGFQSAISTLFCKTTVPSDLSADKISLLDAEYVSLKID